jgi:hypothetical protein
MSKGVFTTVLSKMNKLFIENLNTANENYLKDNKTEFKKYQLAYQMIQKCIEIVTVEARLFMKASNKFKKE